MGHIVAKIRDMGDGTKHSLTLTPHNSITLISTFISFIVPSLAFSHHLLHHFRVGVIMKTRRKTRYTPSSPPLTTTTTYTYRSDSSTPLHTPSTHQIPITLHVHDHDDHSVAAAAKIQAAYRAHAARALIRKITAIKAEVDKLEKMIQQQETVDAVRNSEKEKLRMNEALMVQLLKLDSVPGFDPSVREMRRNLSRRIVALQEVMDGICGEKGKMDGWDDLGLDWDEVIGKIEEDVCRERGGDELEKFCALHLGFRCLQRFLREP